MLKPLRKIGSRRNGRIRSRKKKKNARKVPRGVIHIQASLSNTIVSITDREGRVISWSSGGTCGFKSRRKRTSVAAEIAAEDAIQTVIDQGMRRADVIIKGAGLGREGALKAIRQSGILLRCIRDGTPLPHNGCRPPKKKKKRM